MTKFALTTSDNPFNPFDDFDSWFQFDEEKHYNSCQLLARLARVSNGVSNETNAKAIEQAIDDIVSNLPVKNAKNEGIFYVKVSKGS